MTTHYTAVIDITTPGVVLSDFTLTVPAPSQSSLGINAYGAGIGADINTFDIGPCGDSCVILETLQVGSHHIHDGAIHDSRTPAWANPSVGVHGLYDKSFDTLVENIEFYSHPAGEAYSPRYGNRCKSNIFHDTPYSIGLFNYQGAAIGPTGTLRIRDCVFYNLAAGGYVFYSDGLWRESNGALLGDSTIAVEIDHCTIDIRGMADPFDFSQLHNDVYLTNSVIISDSGLPLSSIITPPTDGSTVHLDGSVVLSSADAATYLGPAPTFTPIVVGGSPVIGTAVASPPGSFAAWGNEGDLGATQTGSAPPGPPPLPGPSVPTLNYFVCGQAGVTSSDTVVIPIDVDVPRSSPANGTIIALFAVGSYLSGLGSPIAVSDDAAPQDDYSLCIFDDGLNHWDANGRYPCLGLIVNDLQAGVNNITCVFASPADQIEVLAVAITGAAAATTSPPQLFDTTPVDYTDDGLTLGEIEAPLGGGTSHALGTAWGYDPFGAVNFSAPIGASDMNWDWIAGNVAFYFIQSNSLSADPGTWVWSDGSIVDFAQSQIDQGIGRWTGFALGIGDPVVLAAAGPTMLAGGWVVADQNRASGLSLAFKAGAGPTCSVIPPPGSGVPIFNNHIRLSE